MTHVPSTRYIAKFDNAGVVKIVLLVVNYTENNLIEELKRWGLLLSEDWI